jgi:Fe(3+) dicitrate transport protein
LLISHGYFHLTMTFRVFKILFLLLLSTNSYAQFRVSGMLLSEEDSTSVKECTIHLDGGSRAAFVNEKGFFSFSDVAAGSHILHFTSSEFQYHQLAITVDNADKHITLYLKPRREILSEVTVSDAGSFGFTKLRAVENMGIYEGKKSEVILPEQLVANLATNNARQIYSRVAGLNIWENDGGGLQLSIGGRGLDPNRTAHFNTRQNGYDISADALGYPESYYTPPVEALGKIQIVRGAASLQYGTQFGGLINFLMKSPAKDKKVELVARQTGGSFGFYNAFTSASGTINKLSYYTFFQYKRGDGWRANSQFNSHAAFANVNYQLTPNTKLGVDYTLMSYLTKQPGGLTDAMFKENARQTNRDRNWFKVNWNLFALHFDHKFNTNNELNVRVFGLSAYRYAVGFRTYRVDTPEDPEAYSDREVITGNFLNWGTEARFLKRYKIGKTPTVLLLGTRYYKGFNHSKQGVGTNGKNADFSFINRETTAWSDYRFPNQNTSAFLEHIFFLSDKLSITPGARFEYINTVADGIYQNINKDNAGNIIEVKMNNAYRNNKRSIFLAGIGLSYKPTENLDSYFNISKNYRSITFSDMQINNPSFKIDPALTDETGFSIDLGIRSEGNALISHDVSLFFMNYDNRIGEVDQYDAFDRVYKFRTNVGRALIGGVEAYAEADVLGLLQPSVKKWNTVVFGNIAVITSEYSNSKLPGVEGMKVEFVPDLNLKSGVRVGYGPMKGSVQYSYVSRQFSDARNNVDGGSPAVFGIIPAYGVVDLSLSYAFSKFRIEGSVNNLTDTMYFTRRATGYPGPGIIPSDGRSFFLTLQAKL